MRYKFACGIKKKKEKKKNKKKKRSAIIIGEKKEKKKENGVECSEYRYNYLIDLIIIVGRGSMVSV